jgi:hypothetical protein
MHLRFPPAEPARLRVVVFFLVGRTFSEDELWSIVEEAAAQFGRPVEKPDEEFPCPTVRAKLSIGGVR